MNWQCGLYLRFSYKDGDKPDSDSIINQKKIGMKVFDKNPDLKLYDTYIDDGYSGTTFNRPEIERLLNDIKERRVNCIIFKDLSRFGRNYHEVGHYIEIVFPLLKTRIISINDNIDSHKNPQSIRNASVSFKNVMNDEYGRDISNKVRGTLNMKRRRGDFIGAFASYGYMKSPENKNKLIIDEEAAEIVRMIFRMFIEGSSVHNIARVLTQRGILNPTEYKINKGIKANKKKLESLQGAWGDTTVRKILQRRMYVGDMVQKVMETVSHKIQKCRAVPAEKRIIKTNTHEAIVDQDTFNKVQELFKRETWQSKVDRSSPKPNTFSGFIKCADCGRSMRLSETVRPYGTYKYCVCMSYSKWKKCSKHAIPLASVEQAVLITIQKYVEMATEMESLLETINKSPFRNSVITRVQKAIGSQEAERAKTIKFLNDLYPDYKNGLLAQEQYIKFKADNENRLASVDKTLHELRQELAKEEQGIDGASDFIKTFKAHGNITTITREVLVELIDIILVEESGGVKISFKFQDEFEQVLDYIKANKALVEGLTHIAGMETELGKQVAL